MGICEKPLSDNCPTEPMLDLLTRYIGMGKDADSLGSMGPFSGENGELGDNKRRLAAAGASRQIDGRAPFKKIAPGLISKRTHSMSSSVISGMRDSASDIFSPVNRGGFGSLMRRLGRHIVDDIHKIGWQQFSESRRINTSLLAKLRQQIGEILCSHGLGSAAAME